MNDQLLSAIVAEMTPVLSGGAVGKVFQLARFALAFDLRASDGRYLFIDVEPGQPRMYLIARKARELERQSSAPSPFLLTLRKQLGGARLRSLAKDPNDRIVRFTFETPGETGISTARSLVAQLTGRTANLFILDDQDRIIDTLRPARGEGQEIGDIYQAPPARGGPNALPPFDQGSCASLSEAADDYYRRLEAARAFTARSTAIAARIKGAIDKRRKLYRNLERDLAAHGDAEDHRRMGELLLANIATAQRHGRMVALTDYYAEGAPVIEIEVDENRSLQEEAARRFARYAKTKRAAAEISRRLSALEAELGSLEARRAELERAIARRDEAALDALDETKRMEAPVPRSRARSKETKISGARRYRSSDGYEILVGRAAHDNDHLTFRVARPHDWWLHAADYPGSHVIVRNPSRGELPHRTLVEAAQLAAHFSQARQDPKVAVHYSQRKFISKPKGTAPGLVRLSSFRSITVEPRESGERLME
jgi:predicted ribosome quality control (RQC) complex YloA/Tae2 family protein